VIATTQKTWTPPELANERWRCRTTLVLQLIRDGKLKAFSLGQKRRPRWRILHEDVLAYEQAHGPGATAAPVRKAKRRDDGEVIRFF